MEVALAWCGAELFEAERRLLRADVDRFVVRPDVVRCCRWRDVAERLWRLEVVAVAAGGPRDGQSLLQFLDVDCDGDWVYN